MTVKIDGIICVNPCENFNPIAQLISKIPAINKINQFISFSPFQQTKKATGENLPGFYPSVCTSILVCFLSDQPAKPRNPRKLNLL